MICHFSCGATSAVATILALMEDSEEAIEAVYADPSMEHEDNKRFMEDFEEIAGIKITVLKSKKYKDPFDVFDQKRFLSGVYGAPCTTELKKKVIADYLAERLVLEPHVFGFTSDEESRIKRFKDNNPEIDLRLPLVDKGLSKDDCLFILREIGISLPMMYKLGYRNANCTGCVKAESIGYWSAIREDFPVIFEKFSERERLFGKKIDGVPRGVAINKQYKKCEDCKDSSCGNCDKNNQVRHRVFLDEIPKDFPPKRSISFSCGYSCGTQDMEFIEDELTKEPTLTAWMILEDIKRWLS